MTILLIEPFYGGSHKELIDLLLKHFSNAVIYKLEAKKWHWRARTSASVLNLAELIALRPDLQKLKKIVYFHENQFIYPKREIKERDFQYGYNQILTALTADIVLFNSSYNLESTFNNLNRHLGLQPEPKIRIDTVKILEKSKIIYFPLKKLEYDRNVSQTILHIIWPHRWEHDKNPQLFFDTLKKLKDNSIPFELSVLGQTYQKIPEVFTQAKIELKDNIVHWGSIADKKEYYKQLSKGHVVVSTAVHEFFGVAMLEGVQSGCFPIVPNSLVYPEIYPKCCLYNTDAQLYKMLKMFCLRPHLAEKYYQQTDFRLERFDEINIVQQFREIFN